MKRHPTRKKVTAHERGDHQGGNLKFARLGCPLCKADVEEVRRKVGETIEAQVRHVLAEKGATPGQIDELIEKVNGIARREGFL